MIDATALTEWNEANAKARQAYNGFAIDDPRHGKVAGYAQHVRLRIAPCEPCRAAQMRYIKKWKLNHLDGTRATVDSLGTRRRIQALCRIGWPMRIIADRARVGIGTVSRIAKGGSERVRQVIAARVAKVYEELSGTPGPARQAVQHAIRKNWAPPLAWDDIDYDKRPRWVAHAA